MSPFGVDRDSVMASDRQEPEAANDTEAVIKNAAASS